jgi:hypothetical protein
MQRQIAKSVAAVMLVLSILSAKPALAVDDSTVCGLETARQESLQAIPDRLLHAISLVESGRWDSDNRVSFAWPWTVTAEGEGRFLPSKTAAIAEVRKLQARGIRNIDVGCMQVNLQAHPDAFASLDEAFEPATNVGYAARFLLELHDSTQNWPTAGAYYHSQTPDLAASYKARLVSTWDMAKRRPDDRLRSASPADILQNRPPIGLSFLLVQDSGQVPPARPASSPTYWSGRKAAVETRPAAERAEAKKIADAYRQARLEEYRLRKAQTGHS